MTKHTVPMYEGYAFDFDGTIYLGPLLIQGADVATRELHDRGFKMALRI